MCLLALYSLALAQGVVERRPAEVIQSANRDVLLMASYLRNQFVAEALLEVMRKGVRVRILSSPYTYLDANSYFLSLYLAGAQLWLGLPNEYLLVVDGRDVYTGRGLGLIGEPFMQVSADTASEKLRMVGAALGRSIPFTYSKFDIARYFLEKR